MTLSTITYAEDRRLYTTEERARLADKLKKCDVCELDLIDAQKTLEHEREEKAKPDFVLMGLGLLSGLTLGFIAGSLSTGGK